MPPGFDGGGTNNYGGGGTNGSSDFWSPPKYVPGLKLTIPAVAGTNVHLGLLEADPAGSYAIYFATNVVTDFWSNLLQGVTGQTNFILPLPASDNGFFRVARADEAVTNAAGIGVYFFNAFVNTNITAAVVEGGPAAATAILVDSTNFAGAVWIPFTSTPLLDIGTNEGVHEVWFGFKGSDGIGYWKQTTVTLDTTPPVVVITNPATASVSQPVIQLQGYSTEPLAAVHYDIANATGTLTNQEGFPGQQFFDTNSFSFTTNWFQCYDVPLAVGTNIITLRATDRAGNVTVTNLNVILNYAADTNAPGITLVWPQDGMNIGGDTFTLRGVMNDGTAHVTANGLTGHVGRDGQFWIAHLPLTNGDNTLTVTATDAAGNSTTTSITVIKSDVIVAINTVSDSDLKKPFVTVSGTISDTSYTVRVNGVPAEVKEDGSWSADNVPVNGSGIAAFDVVANPPGMGFARRSRGVRPLGGGGGSEVDQSLVLPLPLRVQVSSYTETYSNWRQLSYAENTGVPTAYRTRERAWVRNVGGYSHQHEDDNIWDNNCSSSASWPVDWIEGEELAGTSTCDDDYFETPVIPWQNWAVNTSREYTYFSSGDYLTITVQQRIERIAQTRIELVARGSAASDGQQLVRLTVSAAGYSWSLLDYIWPFTSQAGLDYAGDVPLPATNIYILGKSLTPTVTNAAVGELFVLMPAGATRDITPTVIGTNSDYYSFDVHAEAVPLQLAVDANRDGGIQFDDSDTTTADKPYRFWINNDNDYYDSNIADYADLNPASGSDANNFAIGCPRDLEDYTRLWINTAGITTELQNGTFLLALEWKDATDDPQMQLFQAAEINGGSLYLTDTNAAMQQMASPYGTRIIEWRHLNTSKKYYPFIFPANFWANLSADQPVAHLLFDAVSRGSGQLVISIYKNDGETKLAEVPGIYLDLKDAKEMYERWTVGDDLNSMPATTATLVTSPYSYDSSIPAENNYILFVHGWNLAPWERNAFAETAFKRLYWQGYKGRFGAFQWPTGYGFSGWKSAITDPDNYDNSEFNAWISATGLFNKLSDLNTAYPGHVYLMAHSMGNVVAGEALKLAGSSQVVNTYVAMQGAVPAHCYDPFTPTRMIPAPFDSSTPNRYAYYYTNGAPCYFNGTAGAGSYINFYNPNDYALGYWQDDQNLKPDMGFSYNTSSNKFYGAGMELHFPQNPYLIFAYCDEARCYALGAQADVGGAFLSSGGFNQLDLGATYSFGNLHKGHSAEFNSDNMNRWPFWDTSLRRMQLK
jgi:hypothetical protein